MAVVIAAALAAAVAAAAGLRPWTHVLATAAAGLAVGAALLAIAWIAILRRLRRLAAEAASGDGRSADDDLDALAAALGAAGERQRRLAGELADETARRQQAEAALLETNQRFGGDLARREAAELALRQSEDRIQLALQGGDLCLWELLVERMHWIVDHEWLAFRGMTLDPTVGDSTAWEGTIDPSDLVALRARLVNLANDREEVIEHSFRVRRDDGGQLWLMVRGRVSERGDDARATRIAGTMLDVTRWRTMEEQLQQAQKLESIGQLAAGIAHEINTPIQFIGDNTRFSADSFTAVLAVMESWRAASAALPADAPLVIAARTAEEKADLAFVAAEVPRALAQTLEGVERVAEIVRAMKEFAHPGSATLAPTDLNHLIENAVAITRNAWKYVAEVDLQLDRALPPVPLSAGDFNQVLLNLVVNAAQAIEDAQRQGRPAPGRITIATSRIDGMAEVRITDTGCGMTPEVQARIWDPFFTTKEVGRGTGQGLSITLAVVRDKHRGTITCVSQAGLGSTFIVRLPLESSEPKS